MVCNCNTAVVLFCVCRAKPASETECEDVQKLLALWKTWQVSVQEQVVRNTLWLIWDQTLSLVWRWDLMWHAQADVKTASAVSLERKMDEIKQDHFTISSCVCCLLFEYSQTNFLINPQANHYMLYCSSTGLSNICYRTFWFKNFFVLNSIWFSFFPIVCWNHQIRPL